jgi:antitoxin MazE
MEAYMQTVVQKWGNSLGVRIPSMYVKEFNLKNGNSVEITEEDGRIVIVPPKKTLEEMLSRVTKNNIHDPVETGVSVGKEEW